MTELNLTPEQAEILKEVLDSHLSDLRIEITHTDKYDFQEMLKHRKKTLNEIEDMLTH